jgi:hypothetical protein
MTDGWHPGEEPVTAGVGPEPDSGVGRTARGMVAIRWSREREMVLKVLGIRFCSVSADAARLAAIEDRVVDATRNGGRK